MNDGWIKLHRRIKGHWIWRNPTYLKLWLDFLIKANHADNKFFIENRLIQVKKGEFITSLRSLAAEHGLTKGRIKRFINCLKDDSMIDIKTTHKWTQITVCNYVTYQEGRHTDGTQMGHRRDTDGTQMELNKNEKNEKKAKNISVEPLTPLQLAFEEFKQHRQQIKKPVTPLAEKKLLKKLAGYPEDIAIKMIEQSIANGWQGIFELKESNNERIRTSTKHNTSAIARAMFEHSQADFERIAKINLERDNGDECTGLDNQSAS